MHRSPIDASIAFGLMGFSGRSGASSTALGAVRQFGLIEGSGGNTRVSELALKILEPSSATEKIEALRIAAREPEVFRAILDRFDERIPTADEPVRAFLIRELGFSKGGAEDCLSSLRKTVELIAQFADTNLPVVISEDESETHDADLPVKRSEISKAGAKANSVYRIPLTRDCVAEVSFQGDVTERAVERLMMHIELMREVWAED
ncbi:hypothetical protein [Sphingomonas sp. ERG5]|uniref:hypothetical protein n=1 Tax=Sphingomonas sp. ERG5 TaxID=1381597 RepID=UPI00136493A3|nr:hypothetical protein [Sphingomonas sp. ERG5]